jgi:hypothetical protein
MSVGTTILPKGESSLLSAKNAECPVQNQKAMAMSSGLLRQFAARKGRSATGMKNRGNSIVA